MYRLPPHLRYRLFPLAVMTKRTKAQTPGSTSFALTIRRKSKPSDKRDTIDLNWDFMQKSSTEGPRRKSNDSGASSDVDRSLSSAEQFSQESDTTDYSELISKIQQPLSPRPPNPPVAISPKTPPPPAPLYGSPQDHSGRKESDLASPKPETPPEKEAEPIVGKVAISPIVKGVTVESPTTLAKAAKGKAAQPLRFPNGKKVAIPLSRTKEKGNPDRPHGHAAKHYWGRAEWRIGVVSETTVGPAFKHPPIALQ